MTPPPPSPEFLAQSKQPALYAVLAVTYSLALAAVALRLWSRYLKAAGIGVDDLLAVATLAPATVTLVTAILWVKYGLGKHYQTNPPTAFYHFYLCLFIGELCYTTLLVFAKLAILALYRRIFEHSSIRPHLLVLAIVVILWGVAVLIVRCIQCVPIQGFWDKSVDATCKVDPVGFVIGLSVSNILVDVYMLILPSVYIWKLKMTRTNKLIVCGMFLSGGFVTAASITRLILDTSQDYAAPDITWNFAPVVIWAIVEINMAIVCCCLPCLRPAWCRIFCEKPCRQSSGSQHTAAETQSRSRTRILRKSSGLAPSWESTEAEQLGNPAARPFGSQGSSEGRPDCPPNNEASRFMTFNEEKDIVMHEDVRHIRMGRPFADDVE